MLTPNSNACLAFSLVLKSANLDSHQSQSRFSTFSNQHAIFFWIQLVKSSWRVARSQAPEARSAGLPGVQNITGGCSPRSTNLIVVVISPDTAFVSKLAAEQQKGNFLHPRSVMVLYSMAPDVSLDAMCNLDQGEAGPAELIEMVGTSTS